MTQYGFFIDQSRCIGCNSCTIACKEWHDIQPGPVKWMRVHQWERGTFPRVRLYMLPVMCYHCEDPVCVKACKEGALRKEERYGAVLVDTDRCRGCRRCWRACPYGAPQYADDRPGTTMSKCNMCVDRLDQGLKPICVLSCSMRALEFGPLDEITKKYGNLKRLDGMPEDSITRPAVVFKPADPPREVVPWDPDRALALWRKRESEGGEPLPDLFAEASDVKEVPDGMVGRGRLVLKPKNTVELMYYTMDDE
ncbi:MAG: 4Fe-4S dicluster domain-containing protein [Deltaproteobacteria bacterium]|nr:4Fe-4S dicluster domain-containing protein [Deltaproteobacteria bacterium]MBW2123912.1 4Fe-4S dicluster domain-containing protein [Deltaproteobacteria bacterium]